MLHLPNIIFPPGGNIILEVAMRNYAFDPKHIAAELLRTFDYWGYPTESNISDLSNSVYIKLSVGSWKNPKAIHIRVANHRSNGGASLFNYDVAASFLRDGCITYPRLVNRLAGELGKQIPSVFYDLLSQENYKNYAITLQRNKKRRNMV